MSKRWHAATIVQRAWRRVCTRRLVATRTAMRDMSVCVVCRDECVDHVRCGNNHACCVGCALSASDQRCPMCRETRSLVADAGLPVVMAAAGVRLLCAACNVHLDSKDVEFHRAWCPMHRFVCPWEQCAQCVPAAEMATHVRAHGVPCLTPDDAGDVHFHAAVRPTTSFVVVVGDAVVVLTLAAGSFRRGGEPACAFVSLRAYYASSDARLLTARVRQLRVSGEWVEDHRLGGVKPMLATREVAVGTLSAALTPRSMCDEPFDALVFTGVPTPANLQNVKRAGVQDVSAAPAASLLLPNAHTVALLHVTLTRESTSCAEA